jgi:hypothetical protein
MLVGIKSRGIQTLAFALMLSLLGTEAASGTDSDSLVYPIFGDTYRPDLPTDAEFDGFFQLVKTTP